MKRARYTLGALVFAVLAAAFLTLVPSPALALNTPDGGVGSSGGSTCAQDSSGNCPTDPLVPKKSCDDKGGVKIALPVIGNNTCIANKASNGGAIITYLKLVLRVLGGAVGLVITLMIILSGIQYITSLGGAGSESKPAGIKNAKKRLENAIIALVLFLMMYAIIGFLVPGGILT